MLGPRLLLAAAIVAGLVLGTGEVAADKLLGTKRVTVDRVEVEPSPLHGLLRLRLFVSAIDLDTFGSVITVGGAKAWLIEGNPAIKRLPHLLGLYAAADSELAIVFVVQTSAELEADLDAFKEAIATEVLGPLGERGMPPAQAAVIGFADEVTAPPRLTSLAQARGQLEALTSTGVPAEAPHLLEALERSMRMLRRVKPTVEGASAASVRKMIVVLSDGRDGAEDRDAVSRLARQAGDRGVRIHAVAYSPQDRRRPLFTLGELTKVSGGTFRWIPRKVAASSLQAPFKKLLDEIARQYVLTVLVPEDDLPRRVSVATELGDRRLESAAVRVPRPGCGLDTCGSDQYCVAARCVSRASGGGRGFFGWLLLLGGIAFGALAVLVGAGFVITKVGERRAAQPAAVPPGVPGVAAPPGAAAAPAAPAPPGAAAAVRGPVLYVLSGPQTGQRIPLRHGFTLGKAAGCDLSLAHDGFASGHHAQILMDAQGNCQLVDQGSTNGTFVNGVRVTEARLFDGMSIRCGSTELRFLST
jgi:hypothetical protein